MSIDEQTSDSEFIQQRALERDLVAQLSPSKDTQAKARAKAVWLRSLLERVKARDRDSVE